MEKHLRDKANLHQKHLGRHEHHVPIMNHNWAEDFRLKFKKECLERLLKTTRWEEISKRRGSGDMMDIDDDSLTVKMCISLA
jgi:hypothetical protein